MEPRNSRKSIAEQTLKEIQQGYFMDRSGNKISIDQAVRQSVAASRMYTKEELDTLLKAKPEGHDTSTVSVVNQSTLQCLGNVYDGKKKVALLNFASAKNPGGGFLGGSQAQEESLARSGALYPTLIENKRFYDINKGAADTFYTDNLIYSPDVIFFKNDNGDYLEPYLKADVITSPAVNKGALKSVDLRVINEVMKQRMRYVFSVAAQHRVNLLILGAWGCGVFKNDPKDISDNFKTVLAEKPSSGIPEIVFAVLDKAGDTFRAFEGLSAK